MINHGLKSIFHADAIKFASKKIASESGDIRKMFQICKTAAEHVFLDLKSGDRKLPPDNPYGRGVVGIGDIQKAVKIMFNSVLYLAVSHATAYQALLYVALASLHRSMGRTSSGFTLDEVIVKMESVANSFGSPMYIPCPQHHMVLNMISPLGEVSSQKIMVTMF